MANVIERLNGFNIEARVSRHFKTLAGFIGFPVVFALVAHPAFSADDFHDLRRTGVECERRGENHADGFLGAIAKQHGMRDAFAVEVDIGFLDDADLIKLCAHDVVFDDDGDALFVTIFSKTRQRYG
jgi:hypothetical protein